MTGHLKSPPLENVVGYEVVPSRGDLSAGPRRSGARSGLVTNTIRFFLTVKWYLHT